MAEVEVALEEVQQDEEIVEETIAPVKSVKSVEAAPPGNIFDIFKPKDDAAKDAAKDGEKPEDKPADAAADATKPADKTPEAKPNIFDVFKPKTDAGAKTEDPKPLFPANDLFNFKKNAEEAQKAFKEKGLGGWIATVQKNVQKMMDKTPPVTREITKNELNDLVVLYLLSEYQKALAVPSVQVAKIIVNLVKEALKSAVPPLRIIL